MYSPYNFFKAELLIYSLFINVCVCLCAHAMAVCYKKNNSIVSSK